MTKVELVTKTEGVERYMSLTSDEIVEAVARHGEIKDAGKLIKYLIKHKHWSPLEHVHFTFRIETARDVSAQMMRHRSFHWQELSQRYDVIQEFMPIELRKQGTTNRQVGDEVFDPEYARHGVSCSQAIELHIKKTQEMYDNLIREGVARECARRILPMCAKTVVHMTGNLRDFLGYLNVRCEAGTQKEHREVAMAIGKALEKEFPPLAELDWKEGGFM
jgi:thymidylate synthase (FAD)